VLTVAESMTRSFAVFFSQAFLAADFRVRQNLVRIPAEQSLG
jgi:hypothetical protein